MVVIDSIHTSSLRVRQGGRLMCAQHKLSQNGLEIPLRDTVLKDRSCQIQAYLYCIYICSDDNAHFFLVHHHT